MTPKEKAIELVNTFFLPLEESLNANVNTKRKKIAKQHALIAVDAIISYCCADDVLFLHKVKEEIEKL